MLSLVIPTHNRARSAMRLAEALDRMECRSRVEVTFVLDGCADDSMQVLESLDVHRPLKLIETPGLGAAAARNKGAEASTGDVLLFMDDDVMPEPGLLDAHLRAHESRARMIGVGPYPYGPEMPVNPLDFMIRDWWQKRFEEMANPEHVFTYEDCVTGNLSLPRKDFEAVGGFDECFEKDGREDYEIGARLLESGMSMSFVRDALAYHYPTNRPRSALRKWYTFGRADVKMAMKHPELFDSLLLSRWWRIRPACCKISKMVLPLCIGPQSVVAVLGWFFEHNVDRLWQGDYRRLWECSRNATYFLGAASACGGVRQLEEFLANWAKPCDSATCRSEVIDMDLSDGPQTINPLSQTERLFLLARMGDSVAGWVEMPAQDEIGPDALASTISHQCGSQLWRQAVRKLRDRELPIWDVIPRARGASGYADAQAGRKGGSSQGKRPSISIVTLSETKERPSDDILESTDHRPVACVASGAGRLRSVLSRALRECPSEMVALLLPSDRPDPGWAEAALSRFDKPDVGCVLTPAIVRSVRTKGDELYNEMAGFGRVRSWEHSRLDEWMKPADILSSFPIECHRLVCRKLLLKNALDSFSCPSSDPNDLLIRALVGMIYLYQGIMYEPRALVWREPVGDTKAVVRMGIEHSQRMSRAVAEKLDLRGRSRVKTMRMVTRLLRPDVPAGDASAGQSSAWPASARIAGVAAGLQGLLQGITRREREGIEAEVHVEKDEEVIWVS